MYRIRKVEDEENNSFYGTQYYSNYHEEDHSNTVNETIDFSIEQVTKFAVEMSKSWAAQIMEYNNNAKYDIFNLHYIDERVSELKKFLSQRYFPNSGVLFKFFHFVGRVLKNLEDNSEKVDKKGKIEIIFDKKSMKPCKNVLEIEY